ncbi:MAG: hypothetical protein ACLP5H_02805 [Desulfomonilaceae bacterium]
MKRLTLLALAIWFVFFLFLGAEDGFSRGGGGMAGGGFGGGGRSGGASYSGGAASRSPSMSSSQSRSTASQSKPKQSSNVASSQKRPTTPSKVASQPQRPSTPSKGASQQQRPSTPSKVASQLPSTSGQKLSSATGSRVETKVPGTGGAKPSQGQVQQFLNLPQQGGKGMSDLGKVGVGAAAGALGYAGAQQLIGSQRPGGERPGVGDRGGVGERPGAGDRLQASTLPAERPGAGGRPGMGDRPTQLPSRPNAGQIRDNLQGRYDNIFTPQGWKDHPNMANAYWQNFGKHQYAQNHWWRPATWAAVGGWVAGSAWSSPTYYDYGGGIYYQDEQVYMSGKPVASAEEYYQQASTLATTAPPAQTKETEWLPLGVFAISRDQATDSNTLLQLAVDKTGIIAGTYYNTTTDIGRPVRGQLDKKTQRAAWTFSDGKNTDVIMETGLGNLTQDQTEALVHFGKEKTQQLLMVRLDQPKENERAKAGGK